MVGANLKILKYVMQKQIRSSNVELWGQTQTLKKLRKFSQTSHR